MNEPRPRVSIGMPVYNGEQFLVHALDSVLAQTFGDFELVIVDNASIDGTEDVCRAYARRDRRVRYFRNRQNIGASANYNRARELSAGEYFGWLSHDDIYDPRFLACCVDVLDKRPDVVIAHSRICIIDEHGKVTEPYGIVLQTDAASPHRRFYELIHTMQMCTPIYGLMRSSTLARVPSLGNYSSSDVPLLARLGLRGRIYEIPEYLFYHRRHPGHAMALDRFARSAWMDPGKRGRIVLPEWTLFMELMRSVVGAPLPPRERAWCLLYVMCWPAWRRHWRSMGKDAALATLQLIGLSRRRSTTPASSD